MIELTEPLQTAVEEHQNEPIRVVNPRTKEEYVILRAEVYEVVKSLFTDAPWSDGERQAMARLTPSNATLLALAAKYPPPPEFFDADEDIPFDPVVE